MACLGVFLPCRFASSSSYFGSFELIGIGGAIGGSGES